MIERISHDIVALLAAGFFAILFIQSGLDKIVDRKGNLGWMAPHFENSPLKGQVPFFLTVLTVFEFGTGLWNALEFLDLLFGLSWGAARYGLWAAGFTILCLFLGQRLAKDYVGAASLAGYFAVALLGVASAR